ncbi:MFS transporter, OPA family, phosphoglycerate transporter protein [Bifidobacterium bohemicum]|uniref:MFS phosphoglycerate transporter protein n=1 Tax=Bifidobacterium bohemicum DSM 22767 TaxID=1437606 RepID=A0A086ZJY5_9BIFI|nr:MFS transporter [Bifidobacterium bohemicum]KFI46835.1 MFS phosphoglycerate transporter protein [Bifidobacterium bohemicum DSM 22767]SCB82643.1 MFS transporter, OPA family, phosphoglycerate transporter protein [Bifidobacterium bohemicum]
MIRFLEIQHKPPVPAEQAESLFARYKWLSLVGVFVGYAAFYIVRNNFTLSTPELQQQLHLSKGQVGMLSSCLLISYGLGKGFMSSLADKANPKRFMVTGLVICALLNIGLAFFGVTFWATAFILILLGLFQGMGVGPAFITLSTWFKKKNRGFITSVWNTSHNVGGGLVSPLAGFMLGAVGTGNWRIAYYVFPAIIALVVAVVIYFLIKGRPEEEGLPPLEETTKEQEDVDYKDLSSWQILTKYVFPNPGAWLVSFMDTFVYMIRFGILTWLPIFLIQAKGFSHSQMMVAFTFFEWAAIPSTLLAGIVSDKLFKGHRMPPAIISLIVIVFCIIGYWTSESVIVVTVFAALAGCLVYIPQFLDSVQTMEVVPPFAVGSTVGLRGLMSYVLGSTLGTSLLGVEVDHYGWNAGLIMLLIAVVLCTVCAVLLHLFTLKKERAAKQEA